MELTPATSYGINKGHGNGLLGKPDGRSTTSDSSRPHELPLASPLVANDGHVNDRRRGSNAETTSNNVLNCSDGFIVKGKGI